MPRTDQQGQWRVLQGSDIFYFKKPSFFVQNVVSSGFTPTHQPFWARHRLCKLHEPSPHVAHIERPAGYRL